MAAVDSLLEVYARHDRSEAQKEARRKSADDAQRVPDAPEVPEDQQEPLKAVDAFLEKIRAGRKDIQ